MNTVPALTKMVLDDLRYVEKSYELLQMADDELSRKKEWSFGDYAAAFLSLTNFAYSVYKTIDDGGKLVNATLEFEPAKSTRPVATLRKSSAVKKNKQPKSSQKKSPTENH
jgi:hypothetical protein